MIDKNPVSFGSDNHSGVHPKVWAAIESANRGHAHAYGGDEWTVAAQKEFQRLFGPASRVFFVFNGTAANVLALSAIAQPHEAILCSDIAHVNVDEGGAPEGVAGLKLISIPSVQGKMRISEIEKMLVRKGDQHYRQPAVISITQPTEYGTVYTRAEMEAFRALAQEHRLRIHIDGSRLANAAQFLNCTFAELVQGVDVVSFGGTKNGLLGAEAVVFLGDTEAARNFSYTRKRGMQLGSKMRFCAAQFSAYLAEDLWKHVAIHVHELACRLERGLREIPGVKVTAPVESNAVFVCFPKESVKLIREKYFFYVWDEETWEARLMISFDTTIRDVDGFINHVKSVLGKT